VTAVDDAAAHEEELQRNPITESFEDLARLLENAEQPWCVIGGAAMLLHGLVPDRFNDIDVLIGEKDAERLRTNPRIHVIQDGGTHRFRSKVMLRLQDSGIEIELLAGLQVRIGSDWVEVEPRRLVRRRLGSARLFVPAQAELARMFHLFGRDRDIERAHRLEALIKAAKQT
jgi:hypothetical protein